MIASDKQVTIGEERASTKRANIAFNLGEREMRRQPDRRSKAPNERRLAGVLNRFFRVSALLAFLLPGALMLAQDDPLNKVHVTPPPAATPATGAPAGAQAPALTGKAAVKARPGALFG